MSAPLPAPYPLQLSEAHLSSLIELTKDYQILSGSLLKLNRTSNTHTILARPIGSTVFPSIFPRRHFQTALALQPLYNVLYATIAGDEEWLKGALGPLLKDEAGFAAKLWGVHERVKAEGGYALQEVQMGIWRADYMLHRDGAGEDIGSELKQVEFNTMCCAGIAHSERISKMHRHFARSGAYDRDGGYGQSGDSVHGIGLPNLPLSDNVKQVVSALQAAHDAYGPAKSEVTRTGVLMVVDDWNLNVADERPFEYELWDNEVPTYRVLWDEVLSSTSLSSEKELLFYPQAASGDIANRPTQTPVEISVVYFRSGYNESDYTEAGIECRFQLERSRAIKCPSILSHLSGFKMVQQALSSPGQLSRFLPADGAARIDDTFAPLYPLNKTQQGLHARSLACNPVTAVNYVLKPSLEGGGHNIYRLDIPLFLEELPEDLWETYVLMEIITPPPAYNVLISPQGLYSGEVETELGVVGTCLWRQDSDSSRPHILLDEEAGFTLKTKAKGVDEMSVIKGYGCFDSPCLAEAADEAV